MDLLWHPYYLGLVYVNRDFSSYFSFTCTWNLEIKINVIRELRLVNSCHFIKFECPFLAFVISFSLCFKQSDAYYLFSNPKINIKYTDEYIFIN